MNQPISYYDAALIKNGKKLSPPIIRAEHNNDSLWLLDAFGRQEELRVDSISYSSQIGLKQHIITCGEKEYIFTEKS